MFSLSQDKSHLETAEAKIQRLTQEFETLNEAIDRFFAEWNLDSDALAQFNQDREQFTSEAWEQLNEERLKLEEKLKSELDGVPNPLLTKKRYEERKFSPHWLYVR